MLFIAELSLFPTQTPTTYDGVYPNVQLSRKSFVVPVFADTVCFGITNSELGPKSINRAPLSDKIFEIIYAIPEGNTFLPKIGLENGVYSSSTFPLLSETFNIGWRFILYPPFANTPN